MTLSEDGVTQKLTELGADIVELRSSVRGIQSVLVDFLDDLQDMHSERAKSEAVATLKSRLGI